jgi:LysM repeat protein
MNKQREVLIGYLAAILSLLIIGGGFMLSFVEQKPEISSADIQKSTLSPSNTSILPVHTLSPEEPTMKPSEITVALTQTSTETSPACDIPSDWIEIIAGEGDTIDSIAYSFQISADTLLEINCHLSMDMSPGEIVYVPELIPTKEPTKTPTLSPSVTSCISPPNGWVLYTIRSGDTLYSLSQIFGLSVTELQTANCMGNSNYIQAGNTLWVPFLPTQTPTPSSTPKPEKTIEPSATPRFNFPRRENRTPRFLN